jgi:quercetin dioxygenase-like cupin family protein
MFRPCPGRAGAWLPTIGAMEPVTRDVVLDVRLGRPKDTHRVEVRRITMAPNVAAGLHVHNGPVVGSIVEGSVWFQVDGAAESVLEPGDTFFEPEATRIRRFDARDTGVTFLAYFLLGPEQDAEMTFPDP